MTELVAELNYWLALGTIFLQVGVAYLLVEHFVLKQKFLAPYVRRWGLHALFLMTLGSVVLTLLYSEVFGFVPCGLCWLQRVFLYPLPILFGIALIRKRTVEVVDYGMALSSLGLVVALYQHYLQMGGSEFVTCPVAGVGADCARRILFEFGYVTFPLMAATLFAFTITVLLIYRAQRVW